MKKSRISRTPNRYQKAQRFGRNPIHLKITQKLFYIIRYRFGISMFLIFAGFLPLIAQNVPTKPQQPYGNSGLCIAQKHINYTISSVKGASAYKWTLIPDSAGTIINNDTSIYIDFSAIFYGLAKLSVVASNSSGTSPSSDTLRISVYNTPSQPVMPIGDSLACKGGQVLDFYIPSQKEANEYIWQISPSGAGSISPSDTTLRLNIYSNFLGNISLYVSAKNTCLESANSKEKIIKVIQKPYSPSTPLGKDLYCAANDSIMLYTSGSSFATSYNWIITPDTAAQMQILDTLLYLHFNQNFNYSFSVQVQAINQCGISEFSPPLKSYLKNIPSKPNQILGDTDICQGTDISQYKIDSIDEADYYTWYISPDSAGTISGIIPTGNVYWNKNFISYAYINVSASNVCGESEFSDTLKVHSLSKPENAIKPEGIEEMCLNSQDMYYKTQAVKYADSYLWLISPFNAGTISGDSLTAKVDWLNSYVGNVKIAVKGVNQCGYGKTSDSLHISLKNELHAKFSYQKNAATVNFTNESFPELKLNHFIWEFGDSSQSDLSTVSHNYQASGNYNVVLTALNPYCLSDTTKQELNIDINSLAIKTLNDSNIKIYPNPVKNILNIENKEKEKINEVYLTDLQGKVLFMKSNYLNMEAIKIDLSGLKKGCYFLLIKKHMYFYSAKIIKY